MQSQFGGCLRTSQISQIWGYEQRRQFDMQGRQLSPSSYILSGHKQLGYILSYSHYKHCSLLQDGQWDIEHYVQF